MLSSRTKLCGSCRRELLGLFERGFCGPVVPRVALRPRLKIGGWQQQQSRPLTVSSRFRNARPPTDDLETPPAPEERGPLSEDELSAQFEAFRELEEYEDEDTVLNEVEEDGHGDHEPPDLSQAERPVDRIGPDLEKFKEQLNEWRNSGTDAAHIARAARQTFDDFLPEDLLIEGELQIYKRLYGEPLSPRQDIEQDDDPVLLDHQGDEVKYTMVRSPPLSIAEAQAMEEWASFEENDSPEPLSLDAPDEFDTLDMEDELLEIESDPDTPYAYEGSAEERQHPMTTLGKFETRPRTVHMPQEQYLRPLSNVMVNFNNKQLKDVCEKTFGGPGLPDSPLTPRSGKSRAQVAVQLEASQHFMGEMEATAFMTTIMPPAFAAASAALSDARRRLGATWLNELLAKEGGPRVLDAGAAGAGILAWNQIVQAHWEAMHTSDNTPNPPPASKAVVLTGSNPLRHRAAQLLDNTTFIPRLPDYVHTRGRETIDDDRPAQQRKQFDVIISSYSLLPLKEEWEKKQYVQNLWTLLGPGGVLILIEKGVPRGFEAIAGARELLLERFIATPPKQDTYYTALHQEAVTDGAPWSPETGMIVGPCSNHERCPMYKIPGVSIGRKDICSFQQRYIRPGYLQRILGASTRNHDDVDFSYLSVMKGRDLRRSAFTQWSHIVDPLSAPALSESHSGDAPQGSARNTEQWLDDCQSGWHDLKPNTDSSTIEAYAPAHALPRLVFEPMKRRGHAILDVCTPMGTIERWTVPRSFGRQAFRDARKANWGDLWALGAKTRRPRSIRQGAGKDKLAGILSGKLKGRGREERMRNEAMRLRELAAQDRLEEQEERRIDAALEAREAERFGDDDDEGERFGLGRAARAQEYEEMEEEEDQDELDWEIEQRLQAWEAELGDTRPTDKRGRVIKGGKKAKGSRPVDEEAEVAWRPAAAAASAEEDSKP